MQQNGSPVPVPFSYNPRSLCEAIASGAIVVPPDVESMARKSLGQADSVPVLPAIENQANAIAITLAGGDFIERADDWFVWRRLEGSPWAVMSWRNEPGVPHSGVDLVQQLRQEVASCNLSAASHAEALRAKDQLDAVTVAQRAEIDRMVKSLDRADASKAELRRENEYLSRELSRVISQRDDKATTCRDLENKVAALELRIGDLDKELDAAARRRAEDAELLVGAQEDARRERAARDGFAVELMDAQAQIDKMRREIERSHDNRRKTKSLERQEWFYRQNAERRHSMEDEAMAQGVRHLVLAFGRSEAMYRDLVVLLDAQSDELRELRARNVDTVSLQNLCEAVAERIPEDVFQRCADALAKDDVAGLREAFKVMEPFFSAHAKRTEGSS